MTRPSALMRPVAAAMRLTLAVLAFGLTVPAQAGSDVVVDPPDGATLSATEPERRDANHWTLGAGVAATPRFQGADEYRAQPLPLIDVKYGRFFAKFGDGIGVNVIETPIFTAGVSVNWMPGYDDDDVPEGVQGVDTALGARLFGTVRFKGVVATLAATQAITEKERGLLINAGFAYPISVTERLKITPSLGTSWANGKYINGYFGVDSSEAAASGLARYEPTSGFKDISFRLNASYRITDSINAVGSVGLIHLLDKAGDSPIVKRQTQPLALMGITYTF